MPEPLGVQQIIANNDLTADGSACVICLETISEQAIALPCKHSNFDFLCLLSWLEEAPTCPLCKAQISAVEYELQDSKPKTYRLETGTVVSTTPTRLETSVACSASASSLPTPWVRNLRTDYRYPSRQFAARRRRQRSPPPSNEAILQRRKRIYELGLYSLHVGSNRLSGYTDLTPTRFANDPHLVSRARKWIRRELQVFNFLATSNPVQSAAGSSASMPAVPAQRSSSNAEFLLEYIVAILKTVDIKGSKGQAQEMLAEFLGEKSALFLHELNAWLRSPFDDLAIWDRNVRYEWPEGEWQALKKRSREEDAASNEQENDRFKRRRETRWVPD